MKRGLLILLVAIFTLHSGATAIDMYPGGHYAGDRTLYKPAPGYTEYSTPRDIMNTIAGWVDSVEEFENTDILKRQANLSAKIAETEEVKSVVYLLREKMKTAAANKGIDREKDKILKATLHLLDVTYLGAHDYIQYLIQTENLGVTSYDSQYIAGLQRDLDKRAMMVKDSFTNINNALLDLKVIIDTSDVDY